MNRKFFVFLSVLTICIATVCGCYAEFVSECEIAENSQNSATAMHNKEVLGDISENDWVYGPDDAILTLLEYADFQCPYCSNASISLLEFQEAHPDEVRVVYRHFPLSFHKNAEITAAIADAAGAQGKFFAAEKFLYEHQYDWSGMESEEDVVNWFTKELSSNEALSEIDADEWAEAFSDEETMKRARSYYQEVVDAGLINGTPTVFANFIQLDMELEDVLEMVRAEQNLIDHCPDVVIDPEKEYQAVLETEVGDIHIDLFADTAPLTVNNFKYLAENNWYEGIEIFRKQDGFLVQTGDPMNNGFGQTGYYIATEFSENHKYGEKGMVGMANSGRDKNGCQFFISYDLYDYYLNTVKTEHEEDGEELSIDYEEHLREEIDERLNKFSKAYTVFGKVVDEDLDLLDKLEVGVKINAVKVTEK